jgi:hypothetical protein|tara:strand:- start:754 stop:1311 length:558 start_codon:yes stop_codon:yes gene_type:complete
MSTLKLNNIEAATGTAINIASGDALVGTAGQIYAPGMVVQVADIVSEGGTTPISGRLESSSTSYVASNLVGSITPIFANSRINVRFASTINTNTDSNHMVVYTIYRQIGSGAFVNLRETSGHYGIGHVQGSDRVQAPMIAELVDLPNTTSKCTYKIYARSVHGITFELPSTQEEHIECVITEIKV